MNAMQQLLTEHMAIWTAADTEKKSGRGRASGNASSVYGIKKLRELILELAVRGKLMPQGENDEPASELLKRIQAEKAKLVAEGKIKKEKPLAPITENEKAFVLPNGWEWIRVGSLGDWGAGATPLRSVSSYYGGSMPWFKSGELISDFIDSAEETVTELALKECSLRLNQPGDVLLAMYGATIGKASILKIAGTTNQAVCACTPNGSIFNRYLLLMLKAMKSNFVGQGAGGAQPNISREKIIATLTALPPLTEQHRIVAKVDELMALCDQLEAQHSNAAEAHEKLVSHLLGTLTQSQSADDFSANWQRIAANFDTLFTTEASIDALKQTLLQLAVMGKLVPQDADDEPASELLKRNQYEQEKLIAEGKLKKEKSLAAIGENEKTFELPKSWSWTRLTDTAFFQEGPGILAKDFRESGVPLIRIAGMHKDLVSLEGCNFLDEDMVKKKWAHFKLELGDVVLSSSASLGKVAKVSIETVGCIIYTGLIRFRPYTCLDVDYLIQFLNSNEFLSQINKSKTGAAIMHFGPTHLKGMLVPLPPLAEQYRIVAKVDALTALCDQLKTRIQQANQQQQTIADALVAQAVA